MNSCPPAVTEALADAFGDIVAECVVGPVADRRGTALWRVEAPSGDVFALKVTTPCDDPQGHVDSERLALEEAHLLELLERDGVLHDFHQRHGTLRANEGSWLTVRWIAGEDAETVFEKLRGAPDARRAATHAAAMCGAVADLHDAGWRHGDMQEAHFVLDGDRAHLLDFAMAQPPDDADRGGVTYRGAYDFFMSPELAAQRLATRPDRHLALTTASEVWSVCAVVYACWTGVYPISERDTTQSTPALRADLATGDYRDLAMVRPWPFPEFENLITSGMAIDPNHRPTARRLQSAFLSLGHS